MTISAGIYDVKISLFPFREYTEADSVNKFDKIYLNTTQFHITIIEVWIYQGDSVIKSALIGSEGGGSGVHRTSQTLGQDCIVVCCGDSIFCLSIPELSLIWSTKADDATCFEIFPYKDDYIVHGELAISRIGNDGSVLWEQTGADIFTTLEGKPDDFLITPDYILAKDWDNRIHKFDFDGNLIN